MLMMGNPGLYHDFQPGTGATVAMNCWIAVVFLDIAITIHSPRFAHTHMHPCCTHTPMPTTRPTLQKQQGVIGIFFMMGNPGLYHDYEPGTGATVAMNCWIGAAIYVVCLGLSIYSLFMNKRAAKREALEKAAAEED